MSSGEARRELNREAWLTEVGVQIQPYFKGYKLSPWKVTCGWPSRAALSKNKIVGQCFGAESSAAGVFELFVSPLLEEPNEVAGTLAHEMAHVAAGIKAAHGPVFKKVCLYVGLTKGKPTSASPGGAFEEAVRRIVEKVGPYPHRKMIPTVRESKVPTSVRIECERCGCCATMSLKWIGQAGLPTCACGGKMEREEE